MKILKRLELDRLEFDDTVDGIIQYLTGLKGKYSEYDNLRIEPDYCGDYTYYYYLICDRLETDEEEQTRLIFEKDHRKLQESLERRQYEELKAKFEK